MIKDTILHSTFKTSMKVYLNVIFGAALVLSLAYLAKAGA